MSKEPAYTPDSTRERVTLFLAVLTSENLRQPTGSGLSPDRRAYELCRIWFNTIYTPSTRYLDGIKGDRSEDAVAQFWSAFSTDEQDALERFHRFLELRVDMLSDTEQERAIFPQNDAWDALLRHATYVLDELDSNPDALQQKVNWLIDTLIRAEASPAPDALPSSLAEVLQLRQSDE